MSFLEGSKDFSAVFFLAAAKSALTILIVKYRVLLTVNFRKAVLHCHYDGRPTVIYVSYDTVYDSDKSLLLSRTTFPLCANSARVNLTHVTPYHASVNMVNTLTLSTRKKNLATQLFRAGLRNWQAMYRVAHEQLERIAVLHHIPET